MACGSTPKEAVDNLRRQLILSKGMSIRLSQEGEEYSLIRNGNRHKVHIRSRGGAILYCEMITYDASVYMNSCCSCC